MTLHQDTHFAVVILNVHLHKFTL